MDPLSPKEALALLYRQAEGMVVERLREQGADWDEISLELGLDVYDCQLRLQELLVEQETEMARLAKHEIVRRMFGGAGTTQIINGEGGVIRPINQGGHYDHAHVGGWSALTPVLAPPLAPPTPAPGLKAAEHLLMEQVRLSMQSQGQHQPVNWSQPADGRWGNITISEDSMRHEVTVRAEYIPHSTGTPCEIVIKVDRWL